MSDLTRALAFLRAIDERASTRVEQLRFGAVYLRPDLPNVYVRNFVWVDKPVAEEDLPQLLDDAEEPQARAGLAHRRIVFADEESGSRAAAMLGPRGWRVQGDRVMVFRGPVAASPGSSRVEEVEPDALRQASAAAYREHPDVQDEETVQRLLAADELIAQATNERCFAWMEDGAVASCCRLFSDGETAQIENVATLPAFRSRGYAGAVMSKALETSVPSHDLTFLLAADDDWPKAWYERLGFEDAGLLRELLRT